MSKSNNTKENIRDFIIRLDDVENINEFLTLDELHDVDELFNSLENFVQIFDDLETIFIKNNLDDNKLSKLFNLIKNIRERRKENLKTETENRGLTKTFFELPEIISKRLSNVRANLIK